MEKLFESLRHGAANVAGVTYQVAVSVWLAAAGRAGTLPGLDVTAIRPEGFEDVDCELSGGQRLFVQTKERGPGARAIANAEVADIIVHAAKALTLPGTASASEASARTGAASRDVPSSRLAIVTNGQFGSSLPQTGWNVDLGGCLAALPDGDKIQKALRTAIETRLKDEKLPTTLADVLLKRTHLVVSPADLTAQTIRLLEVGLSVHRAIASLIRAELLRDLGDMAARHRNATLKSAERRTRSDLDSIAARLQQQVDVASLEEAVRAGVCEPADFTSSSPVNAVGFFEGVDVSPAHIAAGLDILRPEETSEILSGLASRRYAVIAGPSGSGKSALMWRAARLVERGPRVLRVLRVAASDDVELLVRHVMRQQPMIDMPVLVCVDDLGKMRMAAWPEAQRRLSEIPGVLMLAAARQEDLTPDLSADAAVIDPRLTTTAAGQIHDAIAAAQIHTVLEREEALQLADGLLMEFIALTTTGRRIRDVLSVQVESLADPRRRMEREALRLVCAAHTLGFAVPADMLPACLGAEADQVGDALKRLNGEHLLVADGRTWRGLHDLRTEVLVELLHQSPPPTLSTTYGRVLEVLPKEAHAQAVRSAVLRLSKRAAAANADAAISERLSLIQAALKPVSVAVGHQISRLENSPIEGAIAGYLTSMLEASRRFDTIAYAYALLPYLEKHRPPQTDLASVAQLVYARAFGGVAFNIPQLQYIDRLARQLPARSTLNDEIVAAALPTTLFTRVATAVDLASAVRLCESAEGLLSMSISQATTIYRAHISKLPDPPGSDDDLARADLRAQLTGSLAALAQIHGPAVSRALGPAIDRARDAVASDPYGRSVEVTLQPAASLPASPSSLARTRTYDTDRALIINAVAFARNNSDVPPSAYPPRPGEEPATINAQVVLLARRLFDACPEADLVNAELWQANLRPTRVLDHDEGAKSLRAGVIPRGHVPVHSVAFQAAIGDALGSENWTTRLRAQAKQAGEIVTLLEELPSRLKPTDNQRRRREWIQRVNDVVSAVAALPGRPPERRTVLGLAENTSAARTAADLDEELRAKDDAKDALDVIAGILLQCARGLGDQSALRGAGFRMKEALNHLRNARGQGAPSFAGIGDTLPESLEDLAVFAARLLTAFGRDEVSRALGQARLNAHDLDALLTELAQAVSKNDADAVVRRLSSVGIEATTLVLRDPEPTIPCEDHQAVVLVDAEQWPTTVQTLQSWTKTERSTQNVSARVSVLATSDSALMPMGLTFYGSTGTVLPLPEGDIAQLEVAVGMPAVGTTARSTVQDLAGQLLEYSYEKVRRVNRDSTWYPAPAEATDPTEVASAIRARFGPVLTRTENGERLDSRQGHEATLAQALLELCDLVSSESGSDAGFAHQCAEIDLRNLVAGQSGTQAFLMELAFAEALESDRAAHQGD